MILEINNHDISKVGLLEEIKERFKTWKKWCTYQIERRVKSLALRRFWCECVLLIAFLNFFGLLIN